MIMKPFALLLATLALAPFLPALASEPARPAAASRVTPPALTLAEAETLLVERNLALVAARRGVDIARAQVLVADTSPAPELGYGQTVGQVAESRRLGGFHGARGFTPLQNASVTLSVVIERGGRRELRTRVAQEGVSVAEAQLLDTLRQQVFALRRAFIQGLQARADLDVALANRATLDRTEALLRRQVREGQVPEVDLLRFQASRLAFAQELAAAVQTHAAAVATVAALVGGDAMQPGAAPARTPLLEGLPFALRGSLAARAPEPAPRDTLAAALPNRPDVLAATRNLSVAQANTRLAEAGRSRDVTVGGSLTRTELAQDLPGGSRPVRASDTVGITLSIPIFTQRLTNGNIAVATAQQGQAAAQAQGALATAQAELLTAWASHRQARALVELTAGATLRRAEEAFASTEAAYRAGGRSLLDVLDALRTLNATRVSANAARAALLLALAELEQASGVGGLVPRL